MGSILEKTAFRDLGVITFCKVFRKEATDDDDVVNAVVVLDVDEGAE
jgi:hypothetical protein